jgi:hypothetical protein
MRPNFPGSRKTWMLAALVAGGLVLVQSGALPFWLWALVAVLAVATRLLAHADRYRDELFLSAEGVSRQHGSKLRKILVESVRWDELVKVEVRANETGADRKEMLFLLYGTEGKGVAVPGSVAARFGLVPALEQRLAGLRRDALAEAERSAERRAWTLWERDGEPPPAP